MGQILIMHGYNMGVPTWWKCGWDYLQWNLPKSDILNSGHAMNSGQNI